MIPLDENIALLLNVNGLIITMHITIKYFSSFENRVITHPSNTQEDVSELHSAPSYETIL